MAIKKHNPHNYYRTDLGTNKIWACANPDCTHYMPPHLSHLVEGKRSICWQCGEKMTLHSLNMNEDRPRCDDCRLGLNVAEVDVPLSDAMRARLDSTPEKTEVETARITPVSKTIQDFIKGKVN